MKMILYLSALLLTNASSMAVEVHLADESGNVLENICGHKRNPNINSVHTRIPYTQEECDSFAETKQKKKAYQRWREQIKEPLTKNLNEQLNEGQKNFKSWINKNRKALQNEYSKLYFLNVNLLHMAYVTNVRNVFDYYVHFESGEDGANKFIDWFNKSGGFDLKEWKELCGGAKENRDTVKWSECRGESIAGSKLVRLKHFNPYGEPSVSEQYIYFGKGQ